jgi:phosphate:Na+ symporter
MIGFVQILGGLALFMYGIRLLSAGMEKLAGDQIQKWLDRVTNSRLKSGVFGAVSTAVIQSSGLLMVTMIGLVNANLMTVEQSIGVMLGQEIGTTITAQIVAFDIGYFRLILVILGFIFLEFFPNKDWKKYGEILMGLGIVFVGMSYMSTALDNLIEISWVSTLLKEMGFHPLLGVLVGLVMTALTQSSTAVTSMIVAMGITHVITLEAAVGMILGANIGSCITGFIASLPLSRAARQTSIAQITINVIGVLVFIPFISPYANLIKITSPDLARQIANAHSIFNIAVSAFLFPFVHQIAQFAAWLIPVRKEDEKIKVTAYIDDMQYSVPAVALNEAARELNRLGEITAKMVENSCTALVEMKVELIPSVLEQEDKLADPISKEIGVFIDNLLREDLSRIQQKRAFQIKSLLVDIERVGDLAEDIAQYAEERQDHQVPFSSLAICELDTVWKQAHHIYLLSLQSFINGDKELAERVCLLESEFDQLYWKTRQAHIDRLESGLCHPEADVIYTETLRALERISDHADNLGVSVSRTLS